jgi:hypothetical protein
MHTAERRTAAPGDERLHQMDCFFWHRSWPWRFSFGRYFFFLGRGAKNDFVVAAGFGLSAFGFRISRLLFF